MKKTIIAVSAGLALASAAQEDVSRRDWPALLRVSTNVNGMMLSLEFSDASVVAGERLWGRMVVSNGTQWPRYVGFRPVDTAIGQFVVEDDERRPVPRIIWRTPRVPEAVSTRPDWDALDPGDARTFHGDIVRNYSLTNPGIYLVKGVATVGRQGKEEALQGGGRMIHPIDGAEEMIIETPIVLVTVTPRPASMPPPKPLYTPDEAANMINDAPPVMMATHPRPERPPSVPRVAPREVMAAPLPQGVQDQSVSGAAPAKKEAPMVPSRGILLGLIAVLLSGGLVIYLIWSRRKHSHP
jgi:hypothetical protein